MLLAQVAAGQADDTAATGNATAARFDVGLLSGYGAFLLIAALLSGAVAWVWQRRRLS
jgi:hypothetical protein